MHFVFTYDLSATGERRKQIEEELDTYLKPYAWVRRLSTFYIIKVNSTLEWENLLKQLQGYSNSLPEKFHFIMSPPMTGGTYNGILTEGLWDDINKISK
jgi:hypothetical protein